MGIAPDQLADTHGKTRGLGRLKDAAEEHGVHAGAADVVEEGDDLQLPQRLTGGPKTTSDFQDHLRGPCSVGLVVPRYDVPRTVWVRHVVQGQEGRAVYGREPVFVCHGLASNPPGAFARRRCPASTRSACCSSVPSAVSQWMRESEGLNHAYWRRASR